MSENLTAESVAEAEAVGYLRGTLDGRRVERQAVQDYMSAITREHGIDPPGAWLALEKWLERRRP